MSMCLASERWSLALVQQAYIKCVTFATQVSPGRALLKGNRAHSFTQVCWGHHNAMPSNSKRFSIGICSLSHKMERPGGLGVWKRGLPLCQCLPRRTNEAIESPRAVNELLLHTRGSLNAHQNNLSKPRDAFLRCLMGGQIGDHFNKIPLRLNCISQEDQSGAGWNRRQRLNLYLPSGGALKRGYLLRRQVYSGRTSHWNALVQKVDCGNAEAGNSLDTRMSVSGSRVCSSSLCWSSSKEED